MAKKIIIGVGIGIVLLAVFIGILFVSSDKLTEQQLCENTVGDWTGNECICQKNKDFIEDVGCLPPAGTPTPCPRGFKLEGSECIEKTDEELCENSGGTWATGIVFSECICPKDGFWTEGFGCNWILSGD